MRNEPPEVKAPARARSRPALVAPGGLTTGSQGRFRRAFLALGLAPGRAGRTNWRPPLALAGFFLPVGVGTAALGLPQVVGLPGLALAGAFALFALARTAALDAVGGGLVG